jgi:hypothetical protein
MAADPTLVWGFSMLDRAGKWGWSKCAASDHDQLHEKCKGWETMRASEIFGHSGNKLIPLGKLSPAARTRLREIDLDDLDGLWELRVSGARRIWGTRIGHVFYAIWWDPSHTVCPSLKN